MAKAGKQKKVSPNRRSIFRLRSKLVEDESFSSSAVPLLTASDTSFSSPDYSDHAELLGGLQQVKPLHATTQSEERRTQQKPIEDLFREARILYRTFSTTNLGKAILASLLASALSRCFVPLLLVASAFSLWRLLHYAMLWKHFFQHLPGAHEAALQRRMFFRTVNREGERLVSGDYSRQLVAAYVLNVVTTPGESAIAKLIRFRMSLVNQEVINELREWRERRMGYKVLR